ncbi:MAG: ABC transporter permease [Planctomycetota bacterium]|nr:ABC transporter permease [Planctomycetota bacterium]
MMRFLARRALWFALTVWGVVTLSFLLMRAVPGGPFSSERKLHPTIEAAVEARYHLDWPMWKQYLQTIGPLNLDEHGAFGDGRDIFGGILALDLGPSLQLRDVTVNEIVAQSLPVSAALGAVALAWALGLGIAGGLVSALKPGTRLDRAARLLSTAGLSLPNFVVASLLVLLFAVTIPLFPVAGWGAPKHLVLPGFALGAPFAAYVARLTRAGLLETLSQDYVRTARAKGVPHWRIVLRHALPGALVPVLSFLGPAAAGILTGSLVIERIFCIPGAGSHFVTGALNRDYALAMGVTLVYTVALYVLNTLVDIAYALIDPRVELDGEA